ncbi:hypothetical protein MRS44_004211 [Fusarium solani]|uniref:uncharacterized protein n=1 Tax=Fusarium solani TaxID=169388 RepID=UPI0032C43751|nr:hypothetical protein MRS44_004211 [Fusarium solani]
MPPPNGNTTDFSRQQTLMQFLRLPDSCGKSHSFLEFPEDLQRTLRALAPWQLALLGFKASLSLLWNDRALQQHQADAMLRLLPPHLRELAEELCFSQPEDLPKAQEVDFPMDAWGQLRRRKRQRYPQSSQKLQMSNPNQTILQSDLGERDRGMYSSQNKVLIRQRRRLLGSWFREPVARWSTKQWAVTG